ncbi:MAG TPA: hypothetical protein VD833_25525 [Vicinamibacterales bacterium]|nr:hypothetical protein [Vicinamibacterales bacterium]
MDERDETKVLGDINPEPQKRTRPLNPESGEVADDPHRSVGGGSQQDRTEHSGSRDVTEGTTGGTGPEVGGSRNLRTGSGTTGSDIGNRPE